MANTHVPGGRLLSACKVVELVRQPFALQQSVIFKGQAYFSERLQETPHSSPYISRHPSGKFRRQSLAHQTRLYMFTHWNVSVLPQAVICLMRSATSFYTSNAVLQGFSRQGSRMPMLPSCHCHALQGRFALRQQVNAEAALQGWVLSPISAFRNYYLCRFALYYNAPCH